MQWRRRALRDLLVSIAIAIEALLLHGEMRPVTHLQPEHPAHFFVFQPGPGADDECRTGKSLNAPMAEMQKNSGGRGKSQSLARLRGQLVSCRKWMSLPAMPALVPIERKTSVTQCGGEAGDGEDEAARFQEGTEIVILLF